jgi:probable O-glycosylation ligase (exosortase A-associated)
MSSSALPRHPVSARIATAASESTSESMYTLPFVLVLGYILVDFGRPHSWVPILGYLRPGVIVLGGGILAMLIKRPTIPALGRWVLAFLGLMLVLAPFAYNNGKAVATTRDFGLMTVGAILPIMCFVDSFERFRKLLRFWVWIHVPLALYSITHRGFGIGSFLADENDFAMAMNMAIPYAFALLAVERGTVRRTFLFGTLGILVLATAATMSRGGFIGLAAVLFVLWIRSPRKLVSLALVLVMGIALATLAPARYWKEVGTISTSTNENDTGYQRLYLWKIAWRMFLDHPIVGVGPANYQFNNYFYEDEKETSRGFHVWGRVSHSVYFTVLPEYGIVGTVLFFLIVVKGIMTRRRALRTCRSQLARQDLSAESRERFRFYNQMLAGMDGGIVTFLVTGAFIAVLYYPHLWMLTAFSAVAYRLVEAEVSRAASDHVETAAPGPVMHPAMAAVLRRSRTPA